MSLSIKPVSAKALLLMQAELSSQVKNPRFVKALPPSLSVSFGSGKVDSTEKLPSKTVFKRVKQLGASALNCTILFLAILGGAELYNQGIGDGPLPQFKAYSGPRNDLFQRQLDLNTTDKLDLKTLTPQKAWEALQPTIQILDVVVPEVADWVRDLHHNKKLVFATQADMNELKKQYHQSSQNGGFGGADASHGMWSGGLQMGPHIWESPEWVKAGFFVHEFRHSRQNSVKSIKTPLLRALFGKGGQYGTDPLETEAYLYEAAFYQAIEHPMPEEVTLNLYRAGVDQDQIRHIPKNTPGRISPDD